MELVYYPVFDALCKEASLPTDEFLQACVELRHNTWETLFDFVGVQKYAEVDFALRHAKTANTAVAGGIGGALKNLGSELWGGAKNLWSGATGAASKATGAAAAAAPAPAVIQNTTSMAGQRAKHQKGFFDTKGKNLDQAAAQQSLRTQQSVQRQQALRSGKAGKIEDAYRGGSTSAEQVATARANQAAGRDAQGLQLDGKAGIDTGAARVKAMEKADKQMAQSSVAAQQQGQANLQAAQGDLKGQAGGAAARMQNKLLPGETDLSKVTNAELTNRSFAEQHLGKDWQKAYTELRTALAKRGVDISTPQGQAELRNAMKAGKGYNLGRQTTMGGVKTDRLEQVKGLSGDGTRPVFETAGEKGIIRETEVNSSNAAQRAMIQREQQLAASQERAAKIRSGEIKSLGGTETEVRSRVEAEMQKAIAANPKAYGGTPESQKAALDKMVSQRMANSQRSMEELRTDGLSGMQQAQKVRAKAIKDVNSQQALRGRNVDTQGFSRMEQQAGIGQAAAAEQAAAGEAGSVMDSVKRYAPWAAGGGLAAYGGYKALSGGQQQSQAPYAPYGY